jgi:hypothetical protein
MWSDPFSFAATLNRELRKKKCSGWLEWPRIEPRDTTHHMQERPDLPVMPPDKRCTDLRRASCCWLDEVCPNSTNPPERHGMFNPDHS